MYAGKSIIKRTDRPNWKDIQPLQLRPFRPQYNLTMAVEKVTLSEMINIDKDFLHRIQLRKSILEREITSTIQVSSQCKPAIDELYTFLVAEHLPAKYPEIFKLISVSSNKSNHGQLSLMNCLNKEIFPTVPLSSPEHTMKLLATLVDEDFLFLVPSGNAYTLQGYLMCFSSGFLSAEDGAGMIGKNLSELHKEVPGYGEFLEIKMSRWIERMKPGSYWRRRNADRAQWTITMNGKLRNQVGENQVYDASTHATLVKLDLSQAHLRTELQVMQRLPQSHAVLFSYKTYVYPLQEIKKEGNGPSLADAINGLRKGNVPGMYSYKGAEIWGEQVMAYLRN
ncbi:HRQ family 2 protein [Rutstroemia sp. NJR-2017a WRK4]|nr:HRQ family 2 protein [Rutstroemia sp. NJR-2017a WRK4]